MGDYYVNLYGASGTLTVTSESLIEVIGLEDADEILTQDATVFKYLYNGGFITLYTSTTTVKPKLVTSASALRVYLENELARQKVYRSSAEDSTNSSIGRQLIPIIPYSEKLGPLDHYYED